MSVSSLHVNKMTSPNIQFSTFPKTFKRTSSTGTRLTNGQLNLTSFDISSDKKPIQVYKVLK